MLNVVALALLIQGRGDPSLVIDVRKLASAPVIDGVVDQAEWPGASVVSGFLQYLPRRGEPASQPTEALLAYDDKALYVAFRVSDEHEPTAQLTRRDAELLEDDAVVVVLDTHGDRQSAYYFVTNLLGTQADGRIADDGRTVDGSWDGAWRSAARRTDYGWSAELAIPFASLSFRRGSGVAWGINFGRSRRRTLERSFWAGPLDNQYRVSQAGVLHGLEIPAPSRRHQVIAYGLTRLQEDTATAWDGGVDLRYAVRPDVLLQGTVNPDFATIEADREQINLTRYELSIPEKRPFFLEGSELFRQRIRTFYSRRIADIRGGAKLNGKQGAWTGAFIWANENPAANAAATNYTVARVQRTVGGRSNAALMVADRLRNDAHQGAASADATLFFTKTLGFTGQLVETYGPFTAGRGALFLRPSYDAPTGHFHVRYSHLGQNVADNADAVGFIRDDDRREFDSAIEKLFSFRTGIVEQVEYSSNYNIFWSQAGLLRSWEIVQGLDLELRNRLTVELGHVEDFQRFEQDFRNRATDVVIGYNTREYESIEVGYRFGRNFDSALRLWTASAAYKPTAQLSVEYELERLTLEPDPDGESTWIHVVRANQFFTPNLFLRLLYQTNSGSDRENMQAVFVWRYLPPFGTVQLAFQRGPLRLGSQAADENALFVKATAVF
ncbi:MAG: carbohydrate binding family 9 domain-containing protein [Gemmatimonadetes bacterium]|nr:carbohydrate binding family 9 domain-containing protein [Gemmatimonadota bacterium]